MPRPKAAEPARRGFGRLRAERSGRWSAAYIGPDTRLHRAAATFEAKDDAIVWLSKERDLIARDEWTPPEERRVLKLNRGQTFREYSQTWLDTRRTRRGDLLKPRTKDLYEGLLNQHIWPTFGHLPLVAITVDMVDLWYAGLLPDAPTRRAHAYALLSAMMKSAATGRRRLVRENPCPIEGATIRKKRFEPKPATTQQINTIVGEMPEKYKALIMIAAYCGLRWGEVSELRRKDIDLKAMTIRVERAVVWRKGVPEVGTPKSYAGIRTVSLPPNVRAQLERHLEEFGQPGPDGLLFPNATGTGHLHVNTLSKTFWHAREKAGRPDLRIHDLRHTYGTLTAQAGASLKESMELMGHSSVQAALVYQHVAEGRKAEIATRIAELAEPEAPKSDSKPTKPGDGAETKSAKPARLNRG